MTPFVIILALFIVIRLSELNLASRNEKWLLARGAVEFGKGHYPLMITLHTVFILSIIIEYFYFSDRTISYLFLIVFGIISGVKMVVIRSLGYYWNTKIFRIPGAAPVRKGIYKYVRHPNYILVAAEIITFPLIFQLYYTAAIFTVLNAVMLAVRIKTENQVWSS